MKNPKIKALTRIAILTQAKEIIIESEMEGELDKNDPYYPAIQAIEDLIEKEEDTLES